MIQHVCEKGQAFTDDVYVATDDARIADAVSAFGGRYVMTSDAHRSGTDRCREAYLKIAERGSVPFGVVVNIQGDEPFIDPAQISSLIEVFSDPAVQIATLVKRIEREADLTDPNKVKVVFSPGMEALYFSRSPVPYLRGADPADWLSQGVWFKHIGMYAYRPQVLEAITQLAQTPLELAESLEQLRWLENGYPIRVVFTDHESVGIDTPEDLMRVR